MQINGDLSKLEWQFAEKVGLVDTVSGEAPRQPTTVCLAWSNRYLYAGFECRDTYINATYRGFNDLLYEEEVVEVFIDDNRDLKTYLEFEVNPLNALLHYGIHNNLRGQIITFARTERKIKTAVTREEQIWRAEIAIPFTEFLTAANEPPKPGDAWRINLYRIDRPAGGGVEYSAWSPTGEANFHIPERFGEIIFEE